MSPAPPGPGTFRAWLPQTTRNRFALYLALLSLASFIIWNYLPFHAAGSAPQGSIDRAGIWQDAYHVIRYWTPDLRDTLWAVVGIVVILTAMLSLLTIPLWRFFEASALLRLPPAAMSLIGGIVVARFTLEASGEKPQDLLSVFALALISLNMILAAASLFVMEKEILSPGVDHPQPGVD